MRTDTERHLCLTFASGFQSLSRVFTPDKYRAHCYNWVATCYVYVTSTPVFERKRLTRAKTNFDRLEQGYVVLHRINNVVTYSWA